MTVMILTILSHEENACVRITSSFFPGFFFIFLIVFITTVILTFTLTFAVALISSHVNVLVVILRFRTRFFIEKGAYKFIIRFVTGVTLIVVATVMMMMTMMLVAATFLLFTLLLLLNLCLRLFLGFRFLCLIMICSF